MNVRLSKHLTMTVAIGVLAVGMASCQGGASAGGGSYPTRTIQMVVPYPAGSGTDTTARALADVVNKQGKLGKRVQIVNKEGGAGTVGTTALLNAKGDGYTIGLLPDGPLTLIPHTEKISYDPKALNVIVEATETPVMFVVPGDSPYKTTQDLIDAAKKKPGSITLAEGPLNYAVPATLFEQLTGTKFKRVKFDGDAAASTALLGNNVDVAAMQLQGALPQLKSGKIRALGIMSDEPVDLVPDVTTFASQGFDLTWGAFYVVATPKSTPSAVNKKLTSAFTAAVKSPEFAKSAEKLGLLVGGASGEPVTDEIAAKFKQSGPILESLK